jgi:hypothetical protein
MKRTFLKSASALALVTILLGCVSPPDTSNANLLHRIDTVMRQATPAMTVGFKLSVDQITTGEAIVAEVRSSTPGYVYLFQMGTDGRTLSLLFPNAMDGANYIAADTAMNLPRPSWRMSARGPTGVGHMLAVVTAQALDVLALQANVNLGQLEVTSPYGAAMVTLRETAP